MSRPCQSCPFTDSEEGEQAKNWGCVPDTYEIMSMSREHNVSWGCHSVERVCRGFIEACAENSVLPPSPVVSYGVWVEYGTDVAVKQAKER